MGLTIQKNMIEGHFFILHASSFEVYHKNSHLLKHPSRCEGRFVMSYFQLANSG